MGSFRFPSSLSVSVFDAEDDMPEREDTRRELESLPDIVQPPAPAVPVAVTASLKMTVISLSARDCAESTTGAMPSSGFSE